MVANGGISFKDVVEGDVLSQDHPGTPHNSPWFISYDLSKTPLTTVRPCAHAWIAEPRRTARGAWRLAPGAWRLARGAWRLAPGARRTARSVLRATRGARARTQIRQGRGRERGRMAPLAPISARRAPSDGRTCDSYSTLENKGRETGPTQ